MKNMLKKIGDPFRGFFDRHGVEDVESRVFVRASCMVSIAVFVVWLGDVIFGEHPVEIVFLGLSVVLVPLIAIVTVMFGMIKLGSVLISVGMVTIILPITFFYGGGPYGGNIIWFGFAYVFVGLITRGILKKFIVVAITVEALGEAYISIYHPEMFLIHNYRDYIIDSFFSVFAAGFGVYITMWFIRKMFLMENENLKKESEKVERLNRAQNRFFSNMSHEIRTPINSILGFNEIILRDVNKTEDIEDCAVKIESAGKLLLGIINDILDMSKIESGDMEIVKAPYSVGNMFSEIVDLIWQKAYDKGLKFSVEIDHKLPSVLVGDEMRIKQVIINLLNNGIKYTQKGSVTLRVEVDMKDSHIVEMSISVIDTGMGIKAESQETLFEAFKRIDIEKNINVEGTGLGLSIVKQLVELMDGSVMVNSVYTQGSTFTVRLKQEIADITPVGNLNRRDKKKSEKSVYKPIFVAESARILIVDDNELNLAVETRLISDTKIQTDTARSGIEALGLTLKNRYDLIFMDHLMPEMDGVQCLNLIRTQEGGINRQTPVVVLTANAGSENLNIYQSHGFDGYLLKPVSGEELEKTIHRFLPEGKIVRMEKEEEESGSDSVAIYSRKIPILVTTSSTCDLPRRIAEYVNLDIIPYNIKTRNGIFSDDLETVSFEIVKYMKKGNLKAVVEPPTVEEFENFFTEGLKKANYIIHVASGAGTGEEYQRACQAAKGFGAVSVVDSGTMSSCQGLITLLCYQMAKRMYSVEQIIDGINKYKGHMKGSFIIGNTEYAEDAGNISHTGSMLLRALLLHVSQRIGESGGLEYDRFYFGDEKDVWRKFIRRTLRYGGGFGKDILIVVHVGLSREELEWIKNEIERKFSFKHLIFQHASAATSLRTGPRTVGIVHVDRLSESYGVTGIFDEEKYIRSKKQQLKDHIRRDRVLAVADERQSGEFGKAEPGYVFGDIKGEVKRSASALDQEEGRRNCGSMEGYIEAMKLFSDSLMSRLDELSEYINAGDFENYTIKVHALKSSAKIVGANRAFELARTLEEASKEKKIDYMLEKHRELLDECYRVSQELLNLLSGDEGDLDAEKIEVDQMTIDSAFYACARGASLMDYNTIDSIIKDLKTFSLKDDDKMLLEALIRAESKFDYDRIYTLLEEAGKTE